MAYASAVDLAVVVQGVDPIRAEDLLNLAADVIDAHVAACGGSITDPPQVEARIANIIIAHRLLSVGSPGTTIVQESIDDYSYTTGGYTTVEDALVVDRTVRDILAPVCGTVASSIGMIVTL